MFKHAQLHESVESEGSLGVKLVPYDLFNEVPVTGLQGRVTKVSDGRDLERVKVYEHTSSHTHTHTHSTHTLSFMSSTFAFNLGTTPFGGSPFSSW